MPEITLQQVLHDLEILTANRPDDYSYNDVIAELGEEWNALGDLDCMYFRPETLSNEGDGVYTEGVTRIPCCLIGQVLEVHDLTDLSASENRSGFRSLDYAKQFTEDAQELLFLTQLLQDRQVPWKIAIAWAKVGVTEWSVRNRIVNTQYDGPNPRVFAPTEMPDA